MKHEASYRAYIFETNKSLPLLFEFTNLTTCPHVVVENMKNSRTIGFPRNQLIKQSCED